LKGTVSDCWSDPEVPVTDAEYAPADKLAALMVSVAVAGNVLIVVGLTPHAPDVLEQLNVTVPLNPLCAVMEIGPCVLVLPAFTSGKEVGSDRVKAPLGPPVTISVNEVPTVAKVPPVAA
jgi:hypothetical protein